MHDFFEKHADKIVMVSESGCWIWVGTGQRYGSVKIAGSMHLAHRAAMAAVIGPLPSGISVCHRCDVGFCVNPDHLFLGTHADNMLDRDRKGRAAAKLSSEDINQIRARLARGDYQRDIAADFGISQANVSNIANRKSWRHVA